MEPPPCDEARAAGKERGTVERSVGPEEFRAIFESVPGLYLVVTPGADFTIVAVSDAYLRATMTRREEIVGRGIFDVFPDNPDESGATGVRNLRASLERVVRDGVADVMAVQKYDIRRPASQGGGFEERHWSPVNSPVLGEGGEVRYVVHRVEDVTGLVRDRAARADREERQASSVRRMGEEVLLRTRELGEANRQLKEAHAELAGMRAADARRLAEVADRLELAVEAGDLGTFFCPLPFGELVWNDKCKEHFWLAADAEVDIELFFARLHPEDRERTRAALETAINGREPYDAEYRTVAPDGQRQRWIRAKGRAYYDAAGRPVRIDGVTIDISRQKHAEAERVALLESERAARSEAERLNRLKDEFLATLSHELRTPLNAILGWSQLLRRGGGPEGELEQGLETIERNARAQAQLVEDLLDMSRIVSGRLRLDVRAVDVAAVVGAAVEAVRPAADGKGIRLACEVAPGVGLIAGDAGRLQQVAWNLISNAVKFTPGGGQVRVGVRKSGERVELAVADTGEGIDVAFLPHLFERFRQQDGSTTRRHGGLGLGLSIVKQLVELHGGTVRVESGGLGQGATFTVTLPAKAPGRADGEGAAAGATADAARKASAGTGLASSLEGVRVLVLDDQADAREIMARMLGHAGAVVRAYETAEDALAALTSGGTADVVVSDIGMPGVDGYEFMRRVREMGGNLGKVPAVAVTAFARAEDRARALRAGYQAHVAKPVEPAMLVTAVAAVYRNRRG